MDDAAEITQRLMQPFPPEAIKTRQGGGNSRLRYVEGHTVIHRLIDATDNCFDLRVLNIEQKGNLMTALVELTIPGLGSRQHMGVQMVSERGGEDLVKGAITDAMKKAATLFGVGLELYGIDYADNTQDTPRPASAQPRPAESEGATPQTLTAEQYKAVIKQAWAKTRTDGYAEAVKYLREARDRMTPDQYTDTTDDLKKMKAWTPEGATAP